MPLPRAAQFHDDLGRPVEFDEVPRELDESGFATVWSTCVSQFQKLQSNQLDRRAALSQNELSVFIRKRLTKLTLAAAVAMSCVVAVLLLAGWAWEAVAVLAVACVVILAVILLSLPRGWIIDARRKAAFKQIARGECPACLSMLHPVPAISDGAIVCRSCGAAWTNTRQESPR